MALEINLALLPQLEALKIVGSKAPVQEPKLALHHLLAMGEYDLSN